MIDSLDMPAVARASLIYLHILFFVAATVAITFGDFAIFAWRRVNTPLLNKSARMVSITLTTLWISGAIIIWLDTRFELSAIAANGKLLAKLTVVVILTINGVLLHRYAFPRLSLPQENASRAAFLPALLGGVSAATWFYAAFIGVAKPFSPLGYNGLMALYFVTLVLGIGISMVWIRPRLARQITQRITNRPEDMHTFPGLGQCATG